MQPKINLEKKDRGPKIGEYLFLPVKNANWVKPKEGGLWTSPVDSKWGWREWNDIEQFRDCDERNSFVVQLKEDARIFTIDSFEDLKNAPLLDSHYKRVLDFEYLAKKYDAIWLTAKGQTATHLTGVGGLYGWDCETVLILNPDCCTAVS